MDKAVKDLILNNTGASAIVGVESIQSLWSGYGEIFRCKLAGGMFPSVVVKHVKLPDQTKHPRGWNTDVGHQRKVKSYDIEMNWYQELGKQSDKSCRIPKMIRGLKREGEWFMILEDLNTSGFPLRKSQVNLDEIKVCLTWLANFHAKYMNIDQHNLWEIGTYWHLDTRLEELERIKNLKLKNASRLVDQILNESGFQTLVHGDAKLANFCFSDDGRQVAAVDFQYVGKGCGMKDVAYFLSSCLNENQFKNHENELVDFYFQELKYTLTKNTHNINIQVVIDSWREMYDYAWVDFYRFLEGWSPGHWKIQNHLKLKTQKVLQELDVLTK